MIANLLRSVQVMRQAISLIDAQAAVIAALEGVIERAEREKIDIQLAHSRINRDLILQFIITLDQPELHESVRVKLHDSLRDFNDEVARLEEQTR